MIFDIDYINYVWYLLTPPDHRQPITNAWGAAVMAGKQWKGNAFFDGYMQGNSSPVPSAYNPTATYTTGQRVIYYIQSYTSGFTGSNAYYGDNAVYEAISINADGSNNSGFAGKAPVGNNIVPQNPPASALANTSAALAWLSGYSWIQVYPNFIGANYRVTFAPQKLMYEYALNTWFNTIFRQPSVGVSDIYITPLSPTLTQFYFFPNNVKSYFLPVTEFPPEPVTSDFFFPSNNAAIQNNFTINVPITVYNALSGNAGLREGIVRAFADKICPAGAYYNVATY
jgi:hypothetical protein